MSERGSFGRVGTISRGPSLGGMRSPGGERAFTATISTGFRAAPAFRGEGIKIGGTTRLPASERRLPFHTISLNSNPGIESRNSAGPQLTLERSGISTSPFTVVEPRRPVHTVLSGTGLPRTGNSERLDKSSLQTPKRMQDRVPGTGAYASAEAFSSRPGRDVSSTRELRTLSVTRQMPITEPSRDGGSTRTISPDQLRSLLGQQNISGTIVTDGTRRPSENVRQPIASPFRVEPGPRRFASRVGDQQRANEDASIVSGVQRVSQGSETQNQTVAEHPQMAVTRPQVVWSTGYASSSPRDNSETGSNNHSTRRLELVGEPNDQAERKEAAEIKHRVSTEAQHEERKGEIVLTLASMKEQVLRLQKPENKRLLAPLADVSSSAISDTDTTVQPQEEATPVTISRGVHVAASYVAELEELDRKRKKDKKRVKSFGTRLLERAKLLKQRLIAPVEKPQEITQPLVQLLPVPKQERMRLVQVQPDTAVQLAQQVTAADTKLAPSLHATTAPAYTAIPSVSAEKGRGEQSGGDTGKNEQPEPSTHKEAPDLDSTPKDDVKHIVAEHAKKVSLTLGREAIDSAQANEDDEISGPEVAGEILRRRLGDEKSPLVGQDEDGAFIWRLQMIARFFLATRAIIDFYYKELVSIRPPVTIAKQGEDVTYEQVRLVTDGPKKFDINAKAA